MSLFSEIQGPSKEFLARRQDAERYLALDRELHDLTESYWRNKNWEDLGGSSAYAPRLAFGFRPGNSYVGSDAVLHQAQEVRSARDQILSGENNEAVRQHIWLLRVMEYRKGRREGRFVPMQFQEKIIYDELIPAIIRGDKVLLRSHTGIGKTSIMNYVSRLLYADRLYKVPAGGSTDLAADVFGGKEAKLENGKGGTYFEDGPGTRALREGGLLFIDELDRVIGQTADFALKDLLNAPRGERVKIIRKSGTEDTLEVPGQFALVAAINGGRAAQKGGNQKKYHSQGLDAAVANQFGKVIALGYPPASELYDIALSYFIDDQGAVPSLTTESAQVTLNLLAKAVSSIQEAFARNTIQTFVMTVTTMASLFNTWDLARSRGESFELYLQQRLTKFIDGYDAADEDKIKAIGIFAEHGLLPTATEDDFKDMVSMKEQVAAILVHRQTRSTAFTRPTKPIPPDQMLLLSGITDTRQHLTMAREEVVDDEENRSMVPGTESGTSRREPKTSAQVNFEGKLHTFKDALNAILMRSTPRRILGRSKPDTRGQEIEHEFITNISSVNAGNLTEQTWADLINVIEQLEQKGIAIADKQISPVVSAIVEFWKRNSVMPGEDPDDVLKRRWNTMVDNGGKSKWILKGFIMGVQELIADASDKNDPQKGAKAARAISLLKTFLGKDANFTQFLNAFRRQRYNGEVELDNKAIVELLTKMYADYNEVNTQLGKHAEWSAISEKMYEHFFPSRHRYR